MHTDGNGKAAPSAPPSSIRAFEGRLENVGLFEILDSLASEGTNGILMIDGPPSGRIVFDGGEVRTASRGELEGAVALAQLLLLKRGRFYLVASRGAASMPQAPSFSAPEPTETFATRALRALDGARARLFAHRPDGLLEIPRPREACHHPVEGRAS